MLHAFVCLIGVFGFALTVHAQGQLENPAAGSSQSGIGIISGWKCTAGIVTVQFDDGPSLQAAFGTVRDDTRAICGDTDNGWALLWNWNLLGDGQHTVRVFDDGVQFGGASFTVVTPGEEFLEGASASCKVSNFPAAGKMATLQWQET